jgi:hypothetical protein
MFIHAVHAMPASLLGLPPQLLVGQAGKSFHQQCGKQAGRQSGAATLQASQPRLAKDQSNLQMLATDASSLKLTCAPDCALIFLP